MTLPQPWPAPCVRLTQNLNRYRRFAEFPDQPDGPSEIRQTPACETDQSEDRPADGRSADHVGQQAEEAGALDGLCQVALLLGGDSRDAGGHDLATLGDVALQQLDVLVVDLRRIRTRERARLAAAEERTASR